MLRFKLFLLFIITYSSLSSQSFEGKIYFLKASLTDTSHYTYLVKGSKMRVDEMDKSGSTLQSLLIDLEKKEMTAMSPVRKMYMPFPVKQFILESTDNFKIERKKGKKQILNYSCKNRIIENTKDSITIEYWIANDHFNFFIDFLKISNTSDKSALYYLQFSDIEGSFPMLSVEKDYTGKEILRLEVLKIEKMNLDQQLFTIPFDYISFQR